PSEYAIKRLEAFKYVPLWYFTIEGLADAAKIMSSKHARYNHNLSFTKFLYAKNTFLTHIECAKWPATVVDAFNWFFYNLETHILRQKEEDRERILLHYASRV
ncbi:hypothetical protein ID866_12848, partial [Astraeus odoratus]